MRLGRGVGWPGDSLPKQQPDCNDHGRHEAGAVQERGADREKGGLAGDQAVAVDRDVAREGLLLRTLCSLLHNYAFESRRTSWL